MNICFVYYDKTAAIFLYSSFCLDNLIDSGLCCII